MIATDNLGESFAILTMGLLLLAASRPHGLLAWSGLTLSLFFTYQMRPAYQFLVILVPVLGLVLPGLGPRRVQWLRRRWRVSIGFVAASILPFLGWCTLRWVLVGHFGLVSFGGYALIYLTGPILTDDLVTKLPEEVRPLARAVLRDRERLVPNWRLCLDSQGYFRPGFVEYDEGLADTWPLGFYTLRTAIVLYGDESKEKGGWSGVWESWTPGSGQDWTVINAKLQGLAVALVKARPGFYANYVVRALKTGIKRLLTSNQLLKYLLLLLGTIAGIWHLVFIVQYLRVGPKIAEVKRGPARDYLWELNVTVLLAVSFALLNLLQVTLVAPPVGRYMSAAGVFLPLVVVVALFALGGRIRDLITGARIGL
jgi:hypothetical protein